MTLRHRSGTPRQAARQVVSSGTLTCPPGSMHRGMSGSEAPPRIGSTSAVGASLASSFRRVTAGAGEVPYLPWSLGVSAKRRPRSELAVLLGDLRLVGIALVK